MYQGSFRIHGQLSFEAPIKSPNPNYLELAFINLGWAGTGSSSSINSTLTSLSYFLNTLDPAGAKLLATHTALTINSTLKILDLSNNQLSGESVREFATVLTQNSSLTCVALMTNSTVTSLDLDENDIDDEGISYLTIALMINSSLVEIDLNYNPIEKLASLTRLFDCLDRNVQNKQQRRLNLFSLLLPNLAEEWSEEALFWDRACWEYVSSMDRNQTIESQNNNNLILFVRWPSSRFRPIQD